MNRAKARAVMDVVCVDPFHVTVILVVGSRDECAKALDEEFTADGNALRFGDGFLKGLRENDASVIGGTVACTMFVEPVVIIHAEKPVSVSVLVHEISHAVDFVFRVTGCDPSDGELRAYLAEHLFGALRAGSGVAK